MRAILYGRSAVCETLRANRRECFSLQVLNTVRPAPRIEEILRLAAARRLPVERVPRLKLDDAGVNHQGVALEAGPYPYVDLADIFERAHRVGEPPFVLILDSLKDPQNFGSLLRTAEIAGVHGVVFPRARAVEVTPAVVNASAGASEHLYIASSNLAHAIETLKAGGLWVVGLDARGQPLGSDTDRHLLGAVGLVVGSEGEGLHELTRKKCDALLRLPMSGRIGSLNAAVAGSIALYLTYIGRRKAAGVSESVESVQGPTRPTRGG